MKEKLRELEKVCPSGFIRCFDPFRSEAEKKVFRGQGAEADEEHRMRNLKKGENRHEDRQTR
jgi:hypothetical protein